MVAKTISGLDAASALDGVELVEISQLDATIVISAATISALASDNSYNDSGSGFVAAGFAVGMRVHVSGFTGNVANNIQVGVITALTTGKMTIGGTDGDVIVDDAAGETVTIAKWSSVKTTINAVLEIGQKLGSSVRSEGGDYVVSPDDAGYYTRLTGTPAKNIGIELDATTALPADAEWHFRNVGAGDATIVPVVGVAVNVPNGGTLVIPQGGTVTLKRVATNTFDLLGQTVAA